MEKMTDMYDETNITYRDEMQRWSRIYKKRVIRAKTVIELPTIEVVLGRMDIYGYPAWTTYIVIAYIPDEPTKFVQRTFKTMQSAETFFKRYKRPDFDKELRKRDQTK